MHENRLAEHSAHTNEKSKYLRPVSTPDDTDVSRSTGQRLHTVNPTPTRRNSHGLYILVDTMTGATIGGVQMHHNHASAIRMLHDIAMTPTTGVAKHPEDYELRIIAEIDDETKDVLPRGEIIIIGEQIAAMIANANAQGR